MPALIVGAAADERSRVQATAPRRPRRPVTTALRLPSPRAGRVRPPPAPLRRLPSTHCRPLGNAVAGSGRRLVANPSLPPRRGARAALPGRGGRRRLRAASPLRSPRRRRHPGGCRRAPLAAPSGCGSRVAAPRPLRLLCPRPLLRPSPRPLRLLRPSPPRRPSRRAGSCARRRCGAAAAPAPVAAATPACRGSGRSARAAAYAAPVATRRSAARRPPVAAIADPARRMLDRELRRLRRAQPGRPGRRRSPTAASAWPHVRQRLVLRAHRPAAPTTSCCASTAARSTASKTPRPPTPGCASPTSSPSTSCATAARHASATSSPASLTAQR